MGICRSTPQRKIVVNCSKEFESNNTFLICRGSIDFHKKNFDD